jgi:hypothetical protein
VEIEGIGTLTNSVTADSPADPAPQTDEKAAP